MGLGMTLALVACVMYGIATLLQAVGSKRAEGLGAFLQPLVLIGLVVDGGAFMVSLVAYERAPLFVVQTIIAAAVVIAVLGAPLFLPVRLRRADIVGALIVVAGLVLVGLSAGPEHASRPGGSFTWTVLALTVALGVVSALAYPRGPAWLMAVCSGLGFGLVAIGVRLIDIDGLTWGSAGEIVSSLGHILPQPAMIVLAVGGAVGVVANIRALERGSVAVAASTVSVVEVVVPSAIGILFLGDTVRPGWDAGLAVGVVVALTGCVMLAASPAGKATASA